MNNIAEKITGTVLCCLEEDLKKKNIPFSATLVYLIYLVIYNSGKKIVTFQVLLGYTPISIRFLLKTIFQVQVP